MGRWQQEEAISSAANNNTDNRCATRAGYSIAIYGDYQNSKKGFNEESLKLNEALNKITLEDKSLKKSFIKKEYTKIVIRFSQLR